MNITRRQSILYTVIGLGLFFSLGILLSKTGHRASMVTSVENNTSAGESASNSSRVLMGNFQRSETKNGKKIWEVQAKSGEYFPEQNTAVVKDAIVWFYRNTGETVRLTANEASLHLSGPSLDSCDLSGDVKLFLEEKSISLKTASASYSKETNTVRAPGQVEIHGDFLDLSGSSLIANLGTNSFTLEKNVKSIVKRAVQK